MARVGVGADTYLQANAISGAIAVVGTQFPYGNSSTLFPNTSGTGGTGAFIWTPAGGLANIPLATAEGVNADATVIVGTVGVGQVGVGSSKFFMTEHAGLWTAALGPIDLGVLPGAVGATPFVQPLSQALATDSLGDVVVGSSSNAVGNQEATRWGVNLTSGAVQITDLGNLGGISNATAVSADGATIVGYADNSTARRAVLWNASQPGPQDLGTVAGKTNASAAAVSGNGAIVVGRSYNSIDILNPNLVYYNTPLNASIESSSVAFRWTAATGMQNLNTLLTQAGVNTGNALFLTANSISTDGSYISGYYVPAGSPNQTATRNYTIHYIDAAVVPIGGGTTGPGGGGTTGTGSGAIAGITTPDSVQASIDQVAAARRMILIQEFGEAAQLLGANERIGSGSEIGVFAAGGTNDSLDGGAAGRASYGNGFSILGGVAGGDEHYSHVQTDATFMGALAVRYIYDSGAAWRPYGEVGVWGMPSATFTFTRSYANGLGSSFGSASVNATKYYAYGRLGATFTPSPADEVAFGGELGHGMLHTGSFAEALSRSNPFQAEGTSATDEMTVTKLRLQLTHAFSERLDGTLWGAGAYAVDYRSSFSAIVPGIGVLTPSALRRPVWAEYGARIGYKITPATVVDIYADGVSGDTTIGTDVRIGAGVRYVF